ncbi:hypothetical protein D1007_42276 [Hordeum vulgare]|nr:hypothetical protein D1007_42276 [Hordeum vulgare]
MKLEMLANNLGDWSRSTFGSVRGEIRSLQKELELLRNVTPDRDHLMLRQRSMDRLIELYLREELMWSHLSRVEWLSSRDRNTHFFHMRASMRRRKNLIRALQKQDDNLTDDQVEMWKQLKT